MESGIGILTMVGAGCFGLVVGWVTYRTLRRSEGTGLGDIATVLGAVGGAAVTALFPVATGAFGIYSIGLAVGFFAYARVATSAAREEHKSVSDWLGDAPVLGHRDPDRLPGVADLSTREHIDRD